MSTEAPPAPAPITQSTPVKIEPRYPDSVRVGEDTSYLDGLMSDAKAPDPAKPSGTAPPTVPDPSKTPAQPPKTDIKPPEAGKETLKPAPTDDDIEAFKKELSPKANERFTKLAQKEAERLLQEKLKLHPDSDALKKQLESVQKQYEEAERYLQETNIEKSQFFRKNIGEPEKKVFEAISDIAKRTELDGNRLKSLLTAQDSVEVRQQLAEMIGDLNEIDKDDIKDARRQLLSLSERKKTVLGDPDMALRVAQEEEDKRLASWVENNVKARHAAVEPYVERLKEQLPEAFEEGANFDMETISENAKKALATDIGALPPHVQTDLIMSALLAKPAVERVRAKLGAERDALRAEVEALKKTLASYDRANPGMSTGATGTTEDGTDAYEKGMKNIGI